MTYNPATRTFDCDLTLTDRQVLGFCREGLPSPREGRRRWDEPADAGGTEWCC